MKIDFKKPELKRHYNAYYVDKELIPQTRKEEREKIIAMIKEEKNNLGKDKDILYMGIKWHAFDKIEKRISVLPLA